MLLLSGITDFPMHLKIIRINRSYSSEIVSFFAANNPKTLCKTQLQNFKANFVPMVIQI